MVVQCLAVHCHPPQVPLGGVHLQGICHAPPNCRFAYEAQRMFRCAERPVRKNKRVEPLVTGRCVPAARVSPLQAPSLYPTHFWWCIVREVIPQLYCEPTLHCRPVTCLEQRHAEVCNADTERRRVEHVCHVHLVKTQLTLR